ncbi:MAG: transcription termination factor NusA [Paludibacter sp.]|nr:transcription termination factor NusA [Paludibacter sp.]
MMSKEKSINLSDMFKEFNDQKSIDQKTLISVMIESFKKVIDSSFGTGSSDYYDVIINPDKGDLEIYHNREVVEDGAVNNPNKEIALSEAQKIVDDCELGEEISEPVDFTNFGRRAILTLRQTLSSKILELQKDILYREYSEKTGQIVNAELYQNWKNELLLMDDDGHELYLPKDQQIPNDFYKKGDVVRAVIHEVRSINGNTKIILSRISPIFLRRLFELEVPEIAEGLITIERIARLPGERAKVAVESYDDRIDPVGACVGVKGSRIHGIVRELRNENIDVINYTKNTNLFIARALSPAKIISINIDEENKKAEVNVNPEEVSLAIGKGGANIKLASQLTGYSIDVFRVTPEDDSEDIYLEEFSDEIDEWVIEALKAIGCDTAKDVLKLTRQDLIQRTDLEEETVDYVMKILAAEFADDEKK